MIRVHKLPLRGLFQRRIYIIQKSPVIFHQLWTLLEKFEINPNLNNFKFFKVQDTFTAFQSLQTYVSGVLGTKENDIIEIDNISKIVKAGFDLKTSFRKDKKR